MDAPSGSDGKSQALAPMEARISEESKVLPYRWGYFQGAALIPWSLLVITRKIAFPVTGNGTVLHFSGPFADRDGRRVTAADKVLRNAHLGKYESPQSK